MDNIENVFCRLKRNMSTEEVKQTLVRQKNAHIQDIQVSVENAIRISEEIQMLTVKLSKSSGAERRKMEDQIYQLTLWVQGERCADDIARYEISRIDEQLSVM